MRNLFPASIRLKLILLGVLTFIPVVLGMVSHFLGMRKMEIEKSIAGMEKILSGAVRHEEDTIRETHRILATLAEVPAVLEGGHRANEYLARLLKASPEYTTFGVSRPDGQVFASAVPLKTPTNLSDRSYFQDALKNKSFSTGQYQTGRMSGKPTIPFGYPVIDGQGDVTAVIFVGLDLSFVTKFEAEVDVQTPENSPYVKLDSNGAVLTSYPAAQIFGRGHPLEKSLFERISKEKKGTFVATGVDGVERLYVFSPFRGVLSKEGGYVLLGIPTKALFTDANRLLLTNMAVLSLVGALYLTVMWFGGNTLINRPVGILTDASKRMAAGDLTARSGLPVAKGELGQLSVAFDEMAAELQQKKEALSRAKARLAHILATNPTIVYACSIPGEGDAGNGYPPVFVSERVTDQFGYETREILGDPGWWLKNIHPDDLAIATDLGPLFDHGGIQREYRFRTRDGSYRWVLDQLALVKDEEGTPVEIVGSWVDVSERKRLEKQLQTAQRMESVGTLAGGIAHDFNNALTGILGYGELMRGKVAGDPGALQDLNAMMSAAERASTLTRQLLTYARRLVIEPVNLSLNTLTADLMKLISKVAGEHIEIRTFLAKDLPTIRADRGQIEQVLMNLCLNARDAMPKGGQLLVETEEVCLDEEYVRHNPYIKAGRYALLKVSDTGVGMDEKTRERVFEPFFTTKGPEKGTGLGLAMVYGIVKQHDGYIHLYSELGKGTTFKVYFPSVEALPDAVVETRREETVRGGTETILLAEDEEAVRWLAERVLEDLGYKVLVARNGEEAIEIFRRNEDIALAVLDVIMPRKGGKEAYEEMHKANPKLKVIFMSGYIANAIHESFVLIAGVPFLPKPFGPSSLARKVREVLDKA